MSDYQTGMEAGACKRLERNVRHVSVKLREVADRIERDGREAIVRATVGDATYAQVATLVVNEMTWGVANANLSNVIDAADSADQVRASKDRAEKDDTPVTNQKTGAVNALAAMARAVQGWAEGSEENDRALGGRRDFQPADEQPFVLADILNMINDAAREVGVAPVYGEKR